MSQLKPLGIVCLIVALFFGLAGAKEQSATHSRLRRKALFETTGKETECELAAPLMASTKFVGRTRRSMGTLQTSYEVHCRYLVEGKTFTQMFTLRDNPANTERYLEGQRKYFGSLANGEMDAVLGRTVGSTSPNNSFRKSAIQAEERLTQQLRMLWTITYLPESPEDAVLGDLSKAFPASDSSEALYWICALVGLMGLGCLAFGRARTPALA
jgi:hypothetical protein